MEEIDLKELIQMFLEKKFLIIFVVVLFAVMGAIYTNNFITPKYEASTKLVLVQTGSESSTAEDSESITASDLTLNSKLVYNYTEIANSDVVPSTVIKNLKLNTSLEELQSNISVSSASNAEVMIVSVQHESPETAAKIANEFVKVFMDKIHEIYKVNNVHILDSAKVPQEPCNINLVKNIVIFAFVGAILVSGYILLINMLDTTVKTDSDIEKALGLPVLASIVLTDENTKKKNKQIKKQFNSEEIPFSNNVQFYYDSKPNNAENVSAFSYVNKDNLEENKSSDRHKNSHKKGGR